MNDEFKKQLAAISGQDIGEIKIYSNKDILSTPNEKLDAISGAYDDYHSQNNPGFKQQFPNYIKNLHRDIGDGWDDDGHTVIGTKKNKAININFGEGDYPFYYKGKNSTLVGRVKGNQIIDVKTFNSDDSLFTIQDFAKGLKGDAYRLEKDGKGIYNLSPDAREGYNFLRFQKPTDKQLLANKSLGHVFASSSLEQMQAAFTDRSAMEALNYLGIELNAYKTGPLLEGNGQVTFKAANSTKVRLTSNESLRDKLLGISDSKSSTSLESNQSVSTSKVNKTFTNNLGSTVLESNKSISQNIGRILKKIF